MQVFDRTWEAPVARWLDRQWTEQAVEDDPPQSGSGMYIHMLPIVLCSKICTLSLF